MIYGITVLNQRQQFVLHWIGPAHAKNIDTRQNVHLQYLYY
jgi:hypothetical protein